MIAATFAGGSRVHVRVDCSRSNYIYASKIVYRLHEADSGVVCTSVWSVYTGAYKAIICEDNKYAYANAAAHTPRGWCVDTYTHILCISWGRRGVIKLSIRKY